jgi:UDP-glucose 4-epimerase
MKVLVTGGAGYIGSVVTEALLAAGHAVVVYDNLSKGHVGAVVADAQLIVGDLGDKPTLARALREQQIEAVIHMAADSLVGESVVNPARYYQNNLIAGLNLLDCMRAAGIAQIVFSSTAAVYGEPAKQPIGEDDATHPTNPYGESKLAFERALRWYEAAYEIRFASLRYFNAAGATERNGEAHDPETHLIPNVLLVAAGKKPFVDVFGDDYATADGTCVRDYIHVMDLARAHVMALEILGKRSAIFNLGCGGGGYSVREVVAAAREVTGREIAVRMGPRRAGDPAMLCASSDKIQQDLAWRPGQHDLKQIIASAWQWLQSHPKGYEKHAVLRTDQASVLR